MPLYEYAILNDKGKPTGEVVEFLQRMSDKPYTRHPEDNRKVKKIVSTLGMIGDDRPAWERCKEVKDYINTVKPKWVNDKDKGIRERYNPKKHG